MTALPTLIRHTPGQKEPVLHFSHVAPIDCLIQQLQQRLRDCVGCVSMVSSNAMAVILDEFPHMAGTASSLAGTFRFGIGAIVGALLSLATFNSAWPMIWSIAFCATSSILTRWSAMNGGVIVAENYQAASIRSSLVPLPDLTVSSQISTSQDTKDSLQGQKYRLDANYNLPFSLGLTTSLTRSDRHYRELSEAIDDADCRLSTGVGYH